MREGKPIAKTNLCPRKDETLFPPEGKVSSVISLLPSGCLVSSEMILYWWVLSILCRSLLFAGQTFSNSGSYICLGKRKPRMWNWCTASFLVTTAPLFLSPLNKHEGYRGPSLAHVYYATHSTFLFVCLFVFKIFFWCGPFLKSLLNLLQYCFCFMFWFFGCEACGILAPQPGIKLTPPALEGEVLTTGPPGKSLFLLFKCFLCCGYSPRQKDLQALCPVQ